MAGKFNSLNVAKPVSRNDFLLTFPPTGEPSSARRQWLWSGETLVDSEGTPNILITSGGCARGVRGVAAYVVEVI